MSNTDNMFSGLIGKAINEGIESTRKDNNPAYIRLVIALAGILLFVGNEAVKVIFRKNYGFNGISMFRVIVCFLCFLLLGIISVTFSFESSEKLSEMWFGRVSFFVSGAFYIGLSFYLLRKALLGRKNSIQRQDYSNYHGDNDLLNLLHLHGWSESKIKYLAEPLYTLLLGTAVLFYNPFASIPFFICALSVWGYGIMEFIFMQQPFHPNNATPNGQQNYPQQTSNRVNTDFN